MKYTDFEDYLQTMHSEQNPEVLDDMLPDDYSRWLEDIGVDGVIEYGNRYGKLLTKEEEYDTIDVGDEEHTNIQRIPSDS